MKIIKPGNTTPKTLTKECIKCECIFEFDKNDGVFVSDQRDGDYYVVTCPEPSCNYPVNVSAQLLN